MVCFEDDHLPIGAYEIRRPSRHVPVPGFSNEVKFMPVNGRTMHVYAETDIITENTETEVDYGYYPDMNFSFDDKKILGSDMIPATEITRLRSMYISLRSGWEGYGGLNMDSAKAIHTKVKALSSGTIKIGHTNIVRKDLLPLSNAVEMLYSSFAVSNHPTWQALRTFEKQFTNIGPGIHRRLRELVITGIHFSEIKSIYAACFEQLKKQSTP